MDFINKEGYFISKNNYEKRRVGVTQSLLDYLKEHGIDYKIVER